jgi:hypothetical protein
MTLPSPLAAAAPLPFSEWLWVLPVLGILYFLGNLLLVPRPARGKRLLVFIVGLVLGLFALPALLFMVAPHAQLYTRIPAGVIGVSCGLAALYFLGLSFMGSVRSIERLFSVFLRGL